MSQDSLFRINFRSCSSFSVLRVFPLSAVRLTCFLFFHFLDGVLNPLEQSIRALFLLFLSVALQSLFKFVKPGELSIIRFHRWNNKEIDVACHGPSAGVDTVFNLLVELVCESFDQVLLSALAPASAQLLQMLQANILVVEDFIECFSLRFWVGIRSLAEFLSPSEHVARIKTSEHVPAFYFLFLADVRRAKYFLDHGMAHFDVDCCALDDSAIGLGDESTLEPAQKPVMLSSGCREADNI